MVGEVRNTPPPTALENSNLNLHRKMTKNRSRTPPGKQNYPSDPPPPPKVKFLDTRLDQDQ